jgi:hypothetical protein
MTKEAERLMAEALKVATISGSFSPEEIGARIGMDKLQAELAARALSNAGVLVIGFDCAAHFSKDFRKSRAAASTGSTARPAATTPAKRRKARKTTV